MALVLSGNAFSQTVDRWACENDQVCLTPDAYRGTLQWQESPDGTTWANIASTSGDTLCVLADSARYFRAEVVEGTCDPWYSEVIHLRISIVMADAGPDILDCDGASVTIGGSPSGSGGAGSLSYAWSDGSTTANPSITVGSAPGYILTVTDSIGCTDMDTMGVTANVVIADAGPDTTGCAGGSIGVGGSPAGSGGIGSLSYSWSSGDTVANPNVPVGASGSVAYYLTVTDSLGCMGYDTVVVDTGGSASSGTQTFSYTGSAQMFVVPSCVTSIDVDVQGAQGGANWANNTNYGGRVQATLSVTPGETLMVYVGEQPSGLTGGFNGGGNGETGGAGGGGASDIRQNGNTLNDRVVVAGGAGGGGFWSSQEVVGGVGGGLTGGNGYRNTPSTEGGDGATQTGSGDGTCVSFNNPVCAGGFGFGGAPSGCGCEGYGGGGGWYGGAGSGNCRGGGGGSGYTIPAATNVTHSSGFRAGHGTVSISW